ncbi:amino acid ABC transporter permease [Pigmentiphaga soli]|uniref:Amino acid ABC transporter permease n=1 Tax=Pigmentiphaga soli TaxID=1007095 RepID=A0ABP8HCR2_9BURK
MDYHWNWNIFWQQSPDGHGTYFDTLISGTGWTLAVSLLAWLIALSMGSLVGVLRTTRVGWARAVCTAYVELFRNIPLLVQLFLWYFVLPELLPQRLGDAIKQIAPPWGAFWPAVLCLGFFTSSRVAEQIRAGIESLPRGQRQAATALGLRGAQVYRYVLLPIAYRVVLPPLTSEFMNIIKNSSVALTIGLLEITGRARSMQEFSFQVFEAFTAATLLYMVISLVVVMLARWLERRVAVPGFIGPAGQAGH